MSDARAPWRDTPPSSRPCRGNPPDGRAAHATSAPCCATSGRNGSALSL
ncbi:MAG: hypothetical protein K2G53_06025 [Muribaculaceae bacterium]|nr:hypothetical protein [Muribaculaceae bacterium]